MPCARRRFVDGDERLYVLGQMHGGAVGFSAVHRRAVGPLRKVHEDDDLVVAQQSRVGAGRGIAGHALARCIHVAGCIEEVAQRLQPRNNGGGLAMTGDVGGACIRAQRRPMRQRDVDAVLRHRRRRALRPFDQDERRIGERRQADLLELALVLDPVEIGMHHRKRRQLVALHQGEGRARDFQRLVAREIADHGAGGRGLAGTEIPGEGDNVAGAGQQGEIGHQLRGRRLVDKRDGECGWFSHSAASRCAAWSVGKSQITTVPRPTIESTRTLPPCSSTKERTSDRPSPAPR